MISRQTCPVEGCSKRGTMSSLAQHARAVHPDVDREVYRRAAMKDLPIGKRGKLIIRQRRKSLLHTIRRLFQSRARQFATWGGRIIYFAIFALICVLCLENANDLF